MARGGISRRELLFPWTRRSEAEPVAPGPAERGPQPTPPAPRTGLPPLRPPGALAEAAFLEACHRCGACVAACPAKAIHPRADGTPAIVARTGPCVVCLDLACTHACPSGALRPVADPTAIAMGTAVLEAGWCLAHRGIPCRACVDVCPIPGAIALRSQQGAPVPVVDGARCVGCGLCERACPTEPASIVVLPRGAAPPPVREPA